MSSSYRFSSDTATIDAKLSVQVSHVLKHLTSIVVVMVVQAIAVPWALPVLAPALIVYGVVQGYYRRTSREIQRLDSVAKSPVLNVRRVAAGRPNLCSCSHPSHSICRKRLLESPVFGPTLPSLSSWARTKPVSLAVSRRSGLERP